MNRSSGAAPPSRNHPIVAVWRTRTPAMLSPLSDEVLSTIAREPGQVATMKALGADSALILPITARERTFGTLSLIRGNPSNRFDAGDLSLAEELARRAALAADNARLYQEAHAIAMRERAAAARLRRLSQASLAIGAARSTEEALQTVVDEAVELLGALRASVDFSDGVNPEPYHAEAEPALTDDNPAESEVSEGPTTPAQRDQVQLQVTVSAGVDLQPLEPADAITLGQERPGTHELVASLPGRDGSAVGRISMTGNCPFDEEDRSALTQLAHMVSVVLDNLALQREATGAAAALEADRLKGELLSTVSHELRTPLAAIKGFSSTLLMYFRRLPRAEQIAFLQEIDSAADRLTELVENLLQLSRLESGALKVEREPVALSGVLASAVEDARRRHTQRAIDFDPAPDLPVVLADQRRIRQVVSNLLENAVKFSPDGGAVTIAAHRTPDGSAEFSITDHGIGIPAAERERVFERFHRVTTGRAADIGGTGLGLAICRRIVEQHGGHITLLSVEGEGSTFTVTLPAIT
jgi:signal transduction histidine kinase